jgi:hypothetical protein
MAPKRVRDVSGSGVDLSVCTVDKRCVCLVFPEFLLPGSKLNAYQLQKGASVLNIMKKAGGRSGVRDFPVCIPMGVVLDHVHSMFMAARVRLREQLVKPSHVD